MTSQNISTQDQGKQLAGQEAAGLVSNGMVIGLGTGSTANYFIRALAQRLREGLHITGAVPSSRATQELASSLNIPITTLDIHPELDLYVDGADEIDPQLQLIKGAGGALLREKIVASAAKRFVVVADPSKKVARLGLKFPVPVEVVPLAVTPVGKKLAALGANVTVRQIAGTPFVTDNQNLILDCSFPGGIAHPIELNTQMRAIAGLVETGLFLQMAQQVIIGGPEGIEVLQ